MSQNIIAAPAFAPVAQRVRVWVTLRRWLAVLRMTLIPASLVLVLLILATLRGTSAVFTPWLGLLMWLAGGLAYAWWQRPGAFSALALWDQAAGRREAFASAWWFEQRDEGGDAALAHIAAQREVLPQALTALKQDLPLRPDRWLAVPLLIAILGSFISVVTAPPSEVVAMDAEMTRKAAEEAQKLAQTDWEKKKLAGLNEDESKQVEDLKQKLQKTATDLANAGGKDARDVLAELERRARDAEKLADDLGNGKEAWASEKLIEALRKHADTADLGDSVAAKNAQSAAKAADTLASQLKSPQLGAEAKERMNETLKDVQQQSDKEDRQRTVGQSVLAAGDQMQQGKPAGAGAEFQKLADKMRDLALREQLRKELQQLAQQLRDSGSNIAGQNDSDGAMQQMSQAGQSGQQGQQGSTPQVGQAQNPQQQLSPPGMGQPQQGQQNQMQQPQGGQGQGQQQMLTMGQGQPGQPGQQGQQGSGQPMLLAPVPGAAKPDNNAPVVIMPGDPSPDDAKGPTIAMPGSGQEPGVGKADLNNTPTPKLERGNQIVVQGQQNNEGQSTVRSVEGGARTEQSTRTATQAALESIQAEEAALDEAALPPARREQVRRYFNELRKRFEAK
ncbi:MAG: hypothetical protein ACKVY0_12985 [Prosthecobacter sp.]|uniref:hypothetical protein n=1 Tax=Prosthecobacter sp. TaxID=1965333 RepID=UPI0038FD6B13